MVFKCSIIIFYMIFITSAYCANLFFYLNIEKKVSKPYSIYIDEIALINSKNKIKYFKVKKNFSSLADFGQIFIKKINLLEGVYNKILIKINKKYFNIVTNFKLYEKETKAIFIVWNVKASIGKRKFIPYFYIKQQQIPLRGELLFVTSDKEDTFYTVRIDNNQVTSTLNINGAPKEISLSCLSDRLYIVSEKDPLITVVEVSTFRKVDKFIVPDAISPSILNILNNSLIIGDSKYNMLVKLEKDNGMFIKNIKLGDIITDIVYDKTNRKIYISSYNEQTIYILDEDLNVLNSFKVEGSPKNLYIYNSDLYISNYDTGIVSVYDTKSGKIKYYIRIETPYEIVGINDRLFISSYENKEIGVLYNGHENIVSYIKLIGKPYRMALCLKRGWLYVSLKDKNKIAVIDILREKVIGYIDIGSSISDIKVGRDTGIERCN